MSDSTITTGSLNCKKKPGDFFPLVMLFFFSTTASLAVWAGAFFMGISPRVEHVITWAFIVFGVYGINRYTDIEDFINDPRTRLFFLSRKKYLYLALFLLFASVLWLLASNTFTLYHLLCIYAGIAYSVPLFPWIAKPFSIKWVRLKDITFVKSMLVSLIIGSYFMNKNIHVSRVTVIVLMIGSIFSLFVNTIFCDIRDVTGDKAAGIRTIPAVLNVRKTVQRFIIAPSSIWLITLITLFSLSIIRAATLIFLLFFIFFPAVYLGFYFNKTISERLSSIVADACVPLYAIGLIVLKAFSVSSS